jgi:hypothetical protein
MPIRKAPRLDTFKRAPTRLPPALEILVTGRLSKAKADGRFSREAAS